MAAVNGFGVNFWGWGREDDNMRLRLVTAQRWPPQQPQVPMKRRNFYFRHARHDKAPEVCSVLRLAPPPPPAGSFPCICISMVNFQ